MAACGEVDAWRSSGRYRRPRCGSPFPCEFQFALVSPQQRKLFAVWLVRRRKLAEAIKRAELPRERWRLPEWLRIRPARNLPVPAVEQAPFHQSKTTLRIRPRGERITLAVRAIVLTPTRAQRL